MPRDDAGRWQKGSSGNPGGRPAMATEVREALRVEATTAVNALVAIVKDPKAPPAARVSAARCILDHSIGKPLQAVAIATDERPGSVEHATTEELEAFLASALSKP